MTLFEQLLDLGVLGIQPQRLVEHRDRVLVRPSRIGLCNQRGNPLTQRADALFGFLQPRAFPDGALQPLLQLQGFGVLGFELNGFGQRRARFFKGSTVEGRLSRREQGGKPLGIHFAARLR